MKLTPYILIAAALWVAGGLFALWAYAQLPPGAVIATHFGPDGRPDGFTPKGQGLGIGWGVHAATLAVLAAIPYLSRRPEAMAKAAPYYGRVMVALSAFLLLTEMSVAMRALGWAVDMTRWAFVFLGLLLALIGDVIGKVRRNEFFGVRTPWTMMDERVWDKTQRFTGRLMVAGGLILAVAVLACPTPVVRLPLLLACTLIPAGAGVIYSWAIARAPRAEA